MAGIQHRDSAGKFVSAKAFWGDVEVSLHMDPDAMERLLRGKSGPVVRDLERRCIKVQAAATRLCPVDTGRLRASLSYDVGEDAQGPLGIVGSNVEYAAMVELGTSRSHAQPYLRPALSAAVR